MSQYAVMPLSDYVGSCEVIRHFTGDTAEIKSGDMPDQISLACETALTNGISQGYELTQEEVKTALESDY
ncbi:MAG: hypothetical protein IJE01_01495 [Clostridia bacterium]|nr:hypothetical protein [Clostridia bacterium]